MFYLRIYFFLSLPTTSNNAFSFFDALEVMHALVGLVASSTNVVKSWKFYAVSTSHTASKSTSVDILILHWWAVLNLYAFDLEFACAFWAVWNLSLLCLGAIPKGGLTACSTGAGTHQRDVPSSIRPLKELPKRGKTSKKRKAAQLASQLLTLPSSAASCYSQKIITFSVTVGWTVHGWFIIRGCRLD